MADAIKSNDTSDLKNTRNGFDILACDTVTPSRIILVVPNMGYGLAANMTSYDREVTVAPGEGYGYSVEETSDVLSNSDMLVLSGVTSSMFVTAGMATASCMSRTSFDASLELPIAVRVTSTVDTRNINKERATVVSGDPGSNYDKRWCLFKAAREIAASSGSSLSAIIDTGAALEVMRSADRLSSRAGTSWTGTRVDGRAEIYDIFSTEDEDATARLAKGTNIQDPRNLFLAPSVFLSRETDSGMRLYWSPDYSAEFMEAIEVQGSDSAPVCSCTVTPVLLGCSTSGSGYIAASSVSSYSQAAGISESLFNKIFAQPGSGWNSSLVCIEPTITVNRSGETGIAAGLTTLVAPDFAAGDCITRSGTSCVPLGPLYCAPSAGGLLVSSTVVNALLYSADSDAAIFQDGFGLLLATYDRYRSFIENHRDLLMYTSSDIYTEDSKGTFAALSDYHSVAETPTHGSLSFPMTDTAVDQTVFGYTAKDHESACGSGLPASVVSGTVSKLRESLSVCISEASNGRSITMNRSGLYPCMSAAVPTKISTNTRSAAGVPFAAAMALNDVAAPRGIPVGEDGTIAGIDYLTSMMTVADSIDDISCILEKLPGLMSDLAGIVRESLPVVNSTGPVYERPPFFDSLDATTLGLSVIVSPMPVVATLDRLISLFVDGEYDDTAAHYFDQYRNCMDVIENAETSKTALASELHTAVNTFLVYVLDTLVALKERVIFQSGTTRYMACVTVDGEDRELAVNQATTRRGLWAYNLRKNQMLVASVLSYAIMVVRKAMAYCVMQGSPNVPEVARGSVEVALECALFTQDNLPLYPHVTRDIVVSDITGGPGNTIHRLFPAGSIRYYINVDIPDVAGQTFYPVYLPGMGMPGSIVMAGHQRFWDNTSPIEALSDSIKNTLDSPFAAVKSIISSIDYMVFSGDTITYRTGEGTTGSFSREDAFTALCENQAVSDFSLSISSMTGEIDVGKVVPMVSQVSVPSPYSMLLRTVFKPGEPSSVNTELSISGIQGYSYSSVISDVSQFTNATQAMAQAITAMFLTRGLVCISQGVRPPVTIIGMTDPVLASTPTNCADSRLLEYVLDNAGILTADESRISAGISSALWTTYNSSDQVCQANYNLHLSKRRALIIIMGIICKLIDMGTVVQGTKQGSFGIVAEGDRVAGSTYIPVFSGYGFGSTFASSRNADESMFANQRCSVMVANTDINAGISVAYRGISAAFGLDGSSAGIAPVSPLVPEYTDVWTLPFTYKDSDTAGSTYFKRTIGAFTGAYGIDEEVSAVIESAKSEVERGKIRAGIEGFIARHLNDFGLTGSILSDFCLIITDSE